VSEKVAKDAVKRYVIRLEIDIDSGEISRGYPVARKTDEYACFYKIARCDFLMHDVCIIAIFPTLVYQRL